MDFIKQREYIHGPILTIILIFCNYFVIGGIYTLLGWIINDYILFGISVIIALLYYIPLECERKKSRKITRILTEISGVWLWASLMYVFLIIIIFALDHISIIPNNIKIPIFLTIPVLGIAGYYNAHHNYIRAYELYLKDKTPENPADDVCIIHLSDLHIGSSRTHTTLKQTVDNINRIAKIKSNEGVRCITIISGDIADGSSPILTDSFIEFKDATMPVIFTPGNHDYYQGINNVKRALHKANIIILDNENKIYKDVGLNIVGLSFSFSEKQKEYEIPIVKDLNNVLIYHVPMYWEDVAKEGIELELSGHTHGGQFIPITLFTKMQFKYNHGLFDAKVKTNTGETINSYLSVSEGIGTFATPIRLGTRSEIVVLDIKRVKEI